MKTASFCLIFGAICSLASAENIFCYFASWTVYRPGNGKFDVENIDPNLCTHVLFSFIGLNEDGSIAILDGWESNDDGLKGFSRIVGLKKQNPKLKVLISMGGWNEGSYKYSWVMGNATKRQALAQNVLDFIEKHGFDGFDLDWEYPARRDTADEVHDPEHYVETLKVLKSVLSPKGYLLSAAVTGGAKFIDISYKVPEVSELLDMINVMAYDFHGAFDDYVGHHAPLYPSHLDTEEQKSWNVAAGIEAWIEKGADPAKINLGIGTYGRGFTLANASNTSLYAPVIGGCAAGPYTRQIGILGYNEICELYSDWTYVWDDEQKVPHRVSGNQWVGYEDERSIAIKINYAKSIKLGGAMIWSFDTDDFRGLCGNEKYPLLRTVYNTFKN